ncbi:hypothetical protein FA95DRAFT_1596600 [Auriscalpium vulgare]|uniref:Uncharacterized protein n=1 Tax=Auriscalpium vulgare TaxID=40419 RepID=A0ACB8RP18_9AGAM|nr:hypothetical protein FA95DRAFT_1596600 [Auriscalpium vulgare]
MRNMDCTAKIRPIAPALPIEILLKIFNITTWRTGDVEEPPDRFASNRALANAALVCKSWLAPAREVLYTSIYLANLDLCTSTKHLLRTLSESPAWQPVSMVRAITFDIADYRASDAMTDFTKIIELCGPEDLRTLHIGRFHCQCDLGLHGLRDAMMNAVHLQKFVIAPPSGVMYIPTYEPFATVAQFFQIVQCWPELREIRFGRDMLEPTWDDDEYEESEPSAAAEMKEVSPLKPGVLSHFKSFSDRGNFEARHLLALLQLAPNLSTLTIDPRVIFSRPGIAALEALLQSLTELHLFGSYYGADFDIFAADVGAALASAPVLRYLKTNSICMLPVAFRDALAFPALERLEYELEYDFEEDTTSIDVLTDALRAQPRRIPMLKELALTMDDGPFPGADCFADGSYETLKEACLHRGVRLKEDYDSEIEKTVALLGVPEEDQFKYEPGVYYDTDSSDEY